jgi:hypothetical protein
MKWAGSRVRVRDAIQFLDHSCQVHEHEDGPGTSDAEFDRALRCCAGGKFKVTRARTMSVRRLRAHISNGGVAAMAYYHKRGGHFCLITGLKGVGFLAANDSPASKRQTMSYKRRGYLYKLFRGGRASGVWLLEKKLAARGDNEIHGEERTEEAGSKRSGRRSKASQPKRLPATRAGAS